MSTELIKTGEKKKGRPCLLTPELREKIAASVREVKYLSFAAQSEGINPRTSERWMKLGKLHEENAHPEGDSCTTSCEPDLVAFRTFFISIKKAQAEFTKSRMEQITKAGKEPRNWMANAWQLERTMPNEFGLKTRMEHTGEGGGPIKHKLLDPNRQKLILEQAQKAQAIETQQDAIEGEIIDPVES